VLAQRIGMRLSLTALLVIAGVGFAVQSLVGGPWAILSVAIGWALWALGGSAAATLTTGTIISAAPAERAGSVSALAQTGAELGGALGIAVLGSVGTVIYRAMLTAAIPASISPDQTAAARDTLGGALSVAGQLADPAAAASLLLAAQHAFTTAVQITSVVAALISILTAIVVSIYFGADQPQHIRAAPAGRETENALAACLP